jgi:hypothetical protein
VVPRRIFTESAKYILTGNSKPYNHWSIASTSGFLIKTLINAISGLIKRELMFR